MDTFKDAGAGKDRKPRGIPPVLLETLRAERPRMTALARKVGHVHGSRHPELGMLVDSVEGLFHASEHPVRTGEGDLTDMLESVKALASGYLPPDDACNSYRALFQGLERLDADIRRHLEKQQTETPSPAEADKEKKAERKSLTDPCCGI
jgi:iron-sulfur cluster repair protein YtfE (RIC family)